MTAKNQDHETAADLSNLAGKYLTFSLGAEEYGISILKVKEIIGIMEITKIPKTPDFVLGVINLRGRVSPVISLRRKFSMPDIDYTDRTCIVLVELAAGRSTMMMGVLVDSVSEVINVKDTETEPPPSFGGGRDMDFITGLAKTHTGVKILLNIDRIVSAEEVAILKQTGNKSA